MLLQACLMKYTVNATILDPKTYSALDDLIFPNLDFPINKFYDKYYFEPITYTKDKDFEYSTKIYIYPRIKVTSNQLSKSADTWLNELKENIESDLIIIEQGEIKLADVKSYQTIYHVIGGTKETISSLYEDTLFINRMYFVPVSENYITGIRLERSVNNDRTDVDFWPHWLVFLKSLKIYNYDPTSSITPELAKNTRRYHVRNISFDIPLGESNSKDKWVDGTYSSLVDIWATPHGDIRVSIKTSSKYEFNMIKENMKIENEANSQTRGMFSNFIFSLLGYDFDSKTGYQETVFATDRLLYGNNTYDDYTTELEYKAAYKNNKTVEINIKGNNKAMDEYEDLISAWLAQFVILSE